MKYSSRIMLAALAGASLAASDLRASGYEVYKTDVSIGWPTQFYAAKDNAVKTGRPLVMIWSSKGCDWCNHLKTSINESAKFAAWKASSGYDFLCVEGMATTEDEAAYEFARTVEGTLPKLMQFPFVALVQYAGGKLYATNFVGRLPAYAASRISRDCTKQDKETLVGMLMDNADSFFDSVAAELMPEFAVGNTVGDRLEAEDFTTWVDVPLKRQKTEALEGTLRVSYPCAEGTSECVLPVVWADDEVEKSVHLDFTSFEGYKFKEGGEISLALCGGGGATVAESAIALVKRANSPKNPAWIGTRTEDSLAWGEWTMDLDVAAGKVSAAKANSEDAHLLVSFGGSIWCPDCAKTERYLVDTDEFKAWALANKVACVAIDIPNVNATVESRTGPCLLTRKQKAASATYMAADPDHGAVQSGAGYLSRWMVSDKDAEDVLGRNLLLLGTNTKNGGWNRPERANQYRTGVPVFALVDASSLKVISRIELFASSSPTNSNALAGHIRRFDELLAVANAVDAALEEDNRDISTTTAEVTAGGAEAYGEVSGGDLVDVFAVKGVEFDKRTTLSVTPKGNVEWKLSLVQESEGRAKTVVTATGTNLNLAVSADLDEADGSNVYARVEMTALGGNAASFGADVDATVAYSISAENVATPGTVGFDSAGAEAFIPNGNAFSVAVSRTGGRSGEVKARVYLKDAGSADGQYGFDETNLVWAAGEIGAKQVSFEAWRPDDSLASGSFTLGLELVEGGDALGTDSCEVTLTDTTAPCFASFNIETGAHMTFTAAESLALMNVKAGVVATLKKTSGSLPTGMSLAYDRNTGTVTLKGVPKSAGVYTATYTVTQNRVTGLPATITITVDNPKDVNPHIGVARASQTIPLFSEYVEGTNVVAATLTVSATAANRLTAKFQELGSAAATTFSGSWSDYDPSTGVVSTEFATRTGRTLSLAMDAAGVISAVVDGGRYVGEAALPDSSFAEWAGSYTVTFPEDPSEDGDASMAFATLTVKGNGATTWSATLSNGQVVSGTSQLYGSDGKTAFVPLFKSAAKYAFSSLLKIRRGGGETWADTSANQIIHDAPGTATLECIGNDVAVRTALGGWWSPNAAPSAILDALGYGCDLALVSGVMEPYAVSAGKSGFAFKTPATRTDRLTYTKKTGAFAGTIGVVTPEGASVKASIKGVLLPGWYSCGCEEPAEGEEALLTRPFGAGILTYTARSGRTLTTVSAPVYLVIDEK